MTPPEPIAPGDLTLEATPIGSRCSIALELGLLDTNPVKDLRWTAPRASQAIDPRRVINPGQARARLAAVDAQQPSGPRLVAFFGVMYYCGLRPTWSGTAHPRMVTCSAA